MMFSKFEKGFDVFAVEILGSYEGFEAVVPVSDGREALIVVAHNAGTAAGICGGTDGGDVIDAGKDERSEDGGFASAAADGDDFGLSVHEI